MSQKLLLKTLKWNEKFYMPFFNAKKKKYTNFDLFGYISNKLSYKAVKMKSGNRQLYSLYSNHKTTFLIRQIFFFYSFSETFQKAFLITICQAKRKKVKIFCNIKENP